MKAPDPRLAFIEAAELRGDAVSSIATYPYPGTHEDECRRVYGGDWPDECSCPASWPGGWLYERQAAPRSFDFEYKVRIAVAIPTAWARILKRAGEAHYDWKCREAAKCGVVNALYNVATWNLDGKHEEPCSHPIGWSDCDLMLKILEQADQVGCRPIRAWLRETMQKIEARHAEILALPVVPASPPHEEWRQSIARAVGVDPAQIKTVKELLECDPPGACETHGRCWAHAHWEDEGAPT